MDSIFSLNLVTGSPRLAKPIRGCLKWLLLLVVILSPVPSMAQVATPGFAPAAPVVLEPDGLVGSSATITPANPAAMQWGAPSRAALGQFEAQRTIPGNSNTEKYQGAFAGLRIVTERWSFALEALTQADRENSFEFEETVQEAAGALKLAGFITIGAQLGISAITDGVDTLDGQTRTWGAGIRLGELFYLGGGLQAETVDIVTDTLEATLERENTFYGVALRSGGKGFLYRLEVARNIAPNFTYKGSDFGGLQQDQAALEFNLGGFLLGFTAHQIEENNQGDSVEAQTVDIGFASQGGLNFTGRVTQTARVDANGDSVSDTQMGSLALAVLF